MSNRNFVAADALMTFNQMKAREFPGVEKPVTLVLVSGHDGDQVRQFGRAELNQMGASIPKDHICMVAFWDLSQRPPLDELRPNRADTYKPFFIGAIQPARDVEPQAAFYVLGKQTENDRLIFMTAQQLNEDTASWLKVTQDQGQTQNVRNTARFLLGEIQEASAALEGIQRNSGYKPVLQ